MEVINTIIDKPDKGEFNGSCNRRVCQKPGATWLNHSTMRYYCTECAHMLNTDNRVYALEIWGHDLCTNSAMLKSKAA